MEENQSYGNLKIVGTLNPKNGEYWFTLTSENGIKSFSNKCLYDALSNYGISYEKAKEIVNKYAVTFTKTVMLETFPIDYYKEVPHTKLAQRRKDAKK